MRIKDTHVTTSASGACAWELGIHPPPPFCSFGPFLLGCATISRMRTGPWLGGARRALRGSLAHISLHKFLILIIILGYIVCTAADVLTSLPRNIFKDIPKGGSKP